MIEYENLAKLNQPFIKEFTDVFERSLNEGKFILGRQVAEFELEFARYCGAKFCVGVGNGMDALMLALRSFGFAEGSEVIVPANTYIASILSIINAGLHPVLVEPNVGTYNLDPSLTVKAITPKTVAILVVHLYGKCCPMDDLLTISKKYSLRIIEDCAQAHGAMYNNRKAGTFGDFGAFSFFPTKNLGALGDAGALITDDHERAERIRSMRNYGSVTKNKHDVVGFNSRLDEIQAGFLRVKLNALDSMNQQRRHLAGIYNDYLDSKFIRPLIDPRYFDVYHIYNIRHHDRDRLRRFLLEKGVDTLVHYPKPPHQQDALKKQFQGFSFPVSEEIHATTLSLPISPIHSDSEILEIITLLNSFSPA